MDIPMALRCVKPGAAHLVTAFLCQHPKLLQYMPEALPRSRTWLRSVNWAGREVGDDYAHWAARNVPHIPGQQQQVTSLLSDLADWVRAGTNTEADEDEWDQPETRGRQFVVRPFTPSMSFKTVTKLSADWHEAVASDMSGPQFAFPAPWYSAAKIGAYEFLPIDNSAELYREGGAMHHCASAHADQVKNGYAYFYSIRRDGDRVATLALDRHGNKAHINQIRGPCNAQPPKEITTIVQRWLRTQEPLPPKEVQKPRGEQCDALESWDAEDAPPPPRSARASLDRLRARRRVMDRLRARRGA
jgi:PcfJ-like protein